MVGYLAPSTPSLYLPVSPVSLEYINNLSTIYKRLIYKLLTEFTAYKQGVQMKVRLYYKQDTLRNQWYFFFGDWFSMKQLTRAFASKDEVKQYADNHNIEYDEDVMISIFV